MKPKEVIIQTPEGIIDQAKKIAKKKVFVLLDMEDIVLLRKKGKQSNINKN